MQYAKNLKSIGTNNLIPDPLAPNAEKLTDEYGLKLAMAIAHEWFNGGMINTGSGKSSTFSKRHQWIKEMREYNRGEQDVEQYKKIMARQPGDLELLNLDWNIANYAEKFTNIVSNGISEDYYRIDLRSADKFALLERKDNYNRHRKNMASNPMLEKAKAILGIDLTPKGFVPEDEEELKLYSEIKERPMQEISEEIMINFVKDISGWENIKSQGDSDITLCDIIAGRIITDPNNGVMIKGVDVEALGHSYVEKKDFSDAYYFFEVETITINDIRRESGYSTEVCREIAKTYGNINNIAGLDLNTCDFSNILNHRIQVMRFCYKSDREIVMKAYTDNRNGGIQKVAMRDSDYQVPEGAEKSRLSKRLDTWYEGSYIVGSNKYIYNYKESENIERDSMDRAIPPFIVESTNIYKNKLKSFLSNIIPMLNKLILADLKIQHLMMELKPDLTVINIDQLAQLSPVVKGPDGEEKQNKGKDWQLALSILGVKGVVLEQTINMGDEGGIQKGQSAKPAPSQQGSALIPLLNVWAHYYNIIREITGINPARDGSLPADALVGVNQMAQLASNTATKHIVDAALRFDKRVCETISSRIKGIFTHDEAKHLQEMYEQAVGKDVIEPQKYLKNRSIHEFGFTVQMVPAKEELDQLREDLAIALGDGTIDVSEKSEIMRIARGNFKQANEYMKFVRRRRIKEKMKQDEYNQKLQSQSNSQAAQEKIQGEMQAYQMKKEADLQYEANMSVMELEKLAQVKKIEAPEKAIEFQRDVYIEQIKNLQTINLKKYDNDKKAEREKANSTRQSKMIEQRQKDLGSFDFTDSFDLESLLN